MTEGGTRQWAGGRSGQETRTAAGGDGAKERRMVPPAEPRSYYGRPVIKEPIWKPEIPIYFFTGGLAGASAGLAFAARVSGNDRLARVATGNAFAGVVLSPLLLISDLGKPSRFLNMLRVFKVTSPMSIGSWLLAAEGGLLTVSTAHEFLGWFPRPVARIAAAIAALFGMPLSTYTAALIANTAVPVWHEDRKELPFVFAGGAAVSAGAAAVLLTDARHAGPARGLTIAGVAMEGAAHRLGEHRLGKLAEPYKTGAAGKLRLATMATTGGGGLLMAAGALSGRRSLTKIAAVSSLIGAMLGRWMVFKAGFQSAAAPQYTVESQRERLQRQS
ncbi:MAG: NrfD/PsrC family molybdoenzyme membrane anchor subunit [Thermoleophilaceae bacterium]